MRSPSALASSKINLLGICQGGAFSLCFAAMHPDKVKNLITMVTPVDFHTPENMLSNWTRGMDVDLFVDTLGNVPADLMNRCYLMLKPIRLNQQKYIGLVDILDDKVELENFLRMEKWIFDSPDQAGEAFRQFIKDFYQGNKLVKGGLKIGDARSASGQHHDAGAEHVRRAGSPGAAVGVARARRARRHQGLHADRVPWRPHRHLRVGSRATRSAVRDPRLAGQARKLTLHVPAGAQPCARSAFEECRGAVAHGAAPANSRSPRFRVKPRRKPDCGMLPPFLKRANVMNDVLFVLHGVTLTPWKLIGLTGAFLFTARWFVQLYATKKLKRVVMPMSFWYLSIIGSAMTLAYFIWGKNDSVGIIGNAFPMFVSVYNVSCTCAISGRNGLRRAAPRKAELLFVASAASASRAATASVLVAAAPLLREAAYCACSNLFRIVVEIRREPAFRFGKRPALALRVVFDLFLAEAADNEILAARMREIPA